MNELSAGFEKHYSRESVVRAELSVKTGKFSITVLFGPSGSGKTTVLRSLAGLERPERGYIRFGDETWFDAGTRVCLGPQRRGVGVLFQEYALFPHLSVAGNVGYGLSGLAASERRRKVAEALERFGLQGLGQRFPREISGGQQQRAALARALVRRPRLLLLDEPLSALDAALRETLRFELRRLLEEAGIPVLLVTHDRIEAIALADRVVVMKDGEILQTGAVQDVFTRPRDPSVARIVGVESVVPVHVVRVEGGLATVDAGGGAELLALASEGLGDEAYACIRAEDVFVQRSPAQGASARNQLRARITAIVSEGPLIRIGLDCGFPLTALVTRPALEELQLKMGESVIAVLKAPAVHLVPRS